MNRSKVDKFSMEVKSLLVNLKIAIQELKRDTQADISKETIKELLNQLGEISGIYGINSVLNLSNKLLEIIGGIQKEDIVVEEGTITFLNSAEGLFEKLIDDPLLKNSMIKKEYDQILKHADQLLHLEQSNTKGESAKMSTDKFQEVFIEEAFDLINQLEEKMLQLESDMQDSNMIDQVFRIMHTLKGNSNMFGYVHLGELTHELENIFDSIRSKKLLLSCKILEATLSCIDHFRDLIEDPELSNPIVRVSQSIILGNIKDLLFVDDSTASEKEDDTAKEIKGKSLHTFYLFFNPGTDVLDDGTNPLYFVYDMHELGECLPIPVLSPESTKTNYHPEKCYTAWHIIVVSDITEEDIREHFMFLREESQPKIHILSKGNLLVNRSFINYFKDLAEGNGTILKLDMNLYDNTGNTHKKEGPSKSSRSSKEAIASVRVASQKIDQMMNLISELVTKQAELSLLAGAQENQRLNEVAESIESISRDLRDNAFSISLIPLEKTVLRFQRLVRDVANRFEKKVDFVVEGKETELDKTIIEKIIDPLMHILRNSIDHGIEIPSIRKQKGKPETGTIKLKAYPSGAHVVIEISDDGAGINLAKVKSAAQEKGLITPGDQINNDDLLNLIVSPGFSTAENISEVSGRGVGMDVVNQKISEIRGELEIATEPDKGTVITIRLPLTISIIDCILLKCGGENYLVPLGVVDRCAEVKAADIVGAENRYVVLSNEYIPFVDLRTEFSMADDRAAIQQILMVKHKEALVGIVVDEVIGNYQAVLKSLGEAYKKQEVISGASILGSGEIALVLDTNKIIQEYSTKNELKVNSMA